MTTTRPVLNITASSVASVTAAAKAAIGRAKIQENDQINNAVSKVLQGYDWTLVPMASKYVSFNLLSLINKKIAITSPFIKYICVYKCLYIYYTLVFKMQLVYLFLI